MGRLTSTPAFLGRSNRLATFSGAGVCKVWEAPTGVLVTRLEGLCFGCVENGGTPAAISSDGARIAANTWDDTRIWDAGTGALLSIMVPWCRAYAFSPDGRCLAGLDRDGALHLWSTD